MHEVAVVVFHEAVTAVGVAACDSQAIRVIPATKIVANTGHTTQQPLSNFVYTEKNKVTDTIIHLPSSFQEAESRTISYVARPHH